MSADPPEEPDVNAEATGHSDRINAEAAGHPDSSNAEAAGHPDSSNAEAAGQPGRSNAEAAGPTAGRSVLALHELSVARGGRPVVQDVSLEIPTGEVTALLGPNGAGKSSLVLAVGGVLRPLGGTVKLDGRDLTGRRPERIRKAGVAVVPEGRRLLSELTVEDNLRVATYSLSKDESAAGRAYAHELFPELDKRLGVPGRSLSGGEQQMLVLAQALVSRPSFVLIDELSLGLAPVVVQRLIPTIREIAGSGVGVLLIEQFATVALGLAERAYVMDRGRIRFSGTAAELKAAPELLQTAYLPG
jgi:branched-chain amino acid transport system ATP-binding protein